MSGDYIAKTLTHPKTPVLICSVGDTLRCQCGNEDQNKFLTVTSLAGTSLLGYVCAVCEERAGTGATNAEA